MVEGEALAAPVPMSMEPGKGGTRIFTMRIDLRGATADGKHPKTGRPRGTWPFAVKNGFLNYLEGPPEELSMLRGEDWAAISTQIMEFRKANGFNGCQPLEGMIYYSACCCFLGLPCFLSVGAYEKQAKLMEASMPAINERLKAHGMHAKYDQPANCSGHDYLYFYRDGAIA